MVVLCRKRLRWEHMEEISYRVFDETKEKIAGTTPSNILSIVCVENDVTQSRPGAPIFKP